MIRFILIALSITFLIDSSAQDLKKSTGDLNGAKVISINKSYIFQESPKGYGNIQEFPKRNNRSLYYFEEERNTTWLLLDIPFNGILSFEITPHHAADDYDWMLFESLPDFKGQIVNPSTTLLRSNNSRNDKTIGGKTGLKDGLNNLFEKPGPGKSYSKLVTVKKGQKLALIVDNIYDGGKGFDFISVLRPQSYSQRLLQGVVKDKYTLLPLKAKVICEDDSTGVMLTETDADGDGKYTLEIPADRPVNITATFPEYIFQTFDIPAETKNTVQDFTLENVTSGNKILLFNIHFVPDKDLIKPNSQPELKRVIDLLIKQSTWDVKIIGHTNNNPFAEERYLQKLSFKRAIAIQEYLAQNGIADKRMTSFGMGGKKPLIVTKNPEEGLKNLRVEIVATKR